MADKTITLGSDGTQKGLKDLGSSVYGDKVAVYDGDLSAAIAAALAAGSDLPITLDSEAVILGAGTAAIGKLAANSGVDIGDVDVTSLPAANLGQRAMAASVSVVPASDVTDGTYVGDIKFGESLPAGTASIGTVDVDDIALYPLTPVVTAYTPSTTAYVKVTPDANNLDMVVRARTGSDDLYYAGIVTHKIADATTLAATVPAASEAQDYALSIELADDFQTHQASTAYHIVADDTLTTTNATDEATLVAEANATRTAMIAHFGDTAVHGGRADATNLATVSATVAATDAASARTLLNALYPAYLLHLAVTDGGNYQTVPAGSPLQWPCLGSFFCRTSTSGGTFTTAEFRSA